MKTNLRIIMVIAIAGVLFTTESFAQAIHVPVRFRIEGGDFRETRVDIVNKTTGTTNSLGGKAQMKIILKPNNQYVLEFNKRGYITKKISFSTFIPKSRLKQGMDDFPFEVVLFPQVDDVNIVVFNQPVGLIDFNRMIDDLDFDTDYTKQIQSAIKAAEDEIRKKQAELAMSTKEDSGKKQNKGKSAGSEKTTENDNSSQTRQHQQTAMKGEDQNKEPEADPGEDKKDKINGNPGEEEKIAAGGSGGDDNRSGIQGTSGEDSRNQGKGFSDQDQPGNPLKSSSDNDTRNGSMANGNKGSDDGIVMANGTAGQDERPVIADPALLASSTSASGPVHNNDAVTMETQTIDEGNRVVTKVKVYRNEKLETTYSKVVYNWGAVYYFKESTSISKVLFEQYTALK